MKRQAALLLVALGAGLGLLLMHNWTRAPAEANRAAWSRQLLLEAAAVPEGAEVRLVASGANWQVWRSGRLIARVFHHAGEPGYNGPIPLWVGLDADERILQVRVIEHRETPGLGDRIDRRVSPWIGQFHGRSLADPEPAGWALRRDGGEFDAFSGATITPRAVVTGVRKVLELAERHVEPSD